MVEQKAASGSYSAVYRYTGQELDQETGLYYYGARYYDPRVSVFLGVDPLAEKYAGWSPYNYVMGNPVRFVDPDGREPDWIKEENTDGTVTYTAQPGDSAKSLEEQYGVPFEIGNAIIQSAFGKNIPNGTKEGRSNIHPGDQISLMIVRLPSAKSNDSGDGFLSWVSSFFSGGDQQQHSGDNLVIYGKGNAYGNPIEAPRPSKNGSNEWIDISDMLMPGAGNKGTWASMTKSIPLKSAYKILKFAGNFKKAFGRMSSSQYSVSSVKEMFL